MTDALQKRDNTPTMESFSPQNLPQMMAFAEMLSKSGLVPGVIRGKPSDILVVLLTGHEFGMGPMASLRLISAIDGKAVIGGEAYLAVAQAAPECEFFRLVETTNRKATFEAKRRDDEKVHVLSWTIEQAAVAKLLGKDNWQRYPDAMLRWRCVSALAKLVFASRFAGVYTDDEADDIAATAAQQPQEAKVIPIHGDTTDKLAEKAREAKAAKQPPASQAIVEVVPEKAKDAAPPKTMGEFHDLKTELISFEVIFDADKLSADGAYVAQKRGELAEAKKKAEARKAEREAKRAAGAVSNDTMDRADKAGPAPVDEKLPHEVADEKKAAAAEEGPVMAYGGPHKGKPIRKLDGPTLIDLMKLGNEKIRSSNPPLSDKNKAKVNENLAEIQAVLAEREKKTLAEMEKAQDKPAREPGEDDID